MYKDIIGYELAEGVSQEHLIAVAERIVNEWMRTLPGFVRWEIHTNKDGGYTDIVHWKSKEDAMLAEKEMAALPNAGEWFACYKQGSISSKNLTTVAEF